MTTDTSQIRLQTNIFVALLISLIIIPVTAGLVSESVRCIQISNPREGWAVLMDMNEYPGMSDIPTNHIDARKWNTTLHTLGWQSHHILIINGELNRSIGEWVLSFLSLNADENDVVLFFIFAHGNYITENMEWHSWFPILWSQLASQNKIVMVSACSAGSLIAPLSEDTSPHVNLGSARANEYAWAGLPQEGLPIIGEIFNHFFTAALLNSSADLNENGDVSVEEAFSFAAPQSRTYINDVVFPTFPDFEQLCNSSAPHPVIDDSYSGEFSLVVESGNAPLFPIANPLLPWLLPLLISGLIVVVIVVLVFWYRRGL